MKTRRSVLEREARALMGMSGIQVYECRRGWDDADHYYDIVWRDKRRWSVAYPWEKEKHVLVEIGRKLRYRAAQDEEIERALRKSEEEKAAKEKEDMDTRDVMTRDVMRTVSDKPLYFY